MTLLAQCVQCLEDILAADERGQGLPFKEALDEAAQLVHIVKSRARIKYGYTAKNKEAK